MPCAHPHPTYIETRSQPIFAVFHAAEPRREAAAPVLICSPWGWDEVASYRPRRAWAEELAAAGHPTLRFDLPGVGDSGGSPHDPGLVASWLDSIRAAGAWLEARCGNERIAILGLGLGGLLATVGLESGVRAAELITLAAPASGRAFVRGARNFSRLQAWNGGAASGELPAGWVEASGFVLTAATIAELEALEPAGELGPATRRVLTLGRQAAPTASWAGAGFAAAGIELTSEAVAGWGRMVSHPERSRLAAEVAAKVLTWLEAGAAAGPRGAASAAADPEPPGTRGALELGGPPLAVREAPFAVEQPFGESFGILAAPATAAPAPLCAVFLNAGAVRNTGPNRMWVERARAWAAAGVPALRVDLEAIGDADGDPAGIPPGEAFFDPKYEAQVGRILDALEARGLGPDFFLVGLCSGGYFGFRAACADRRVRAACLINPAVLAWRPGIFTEREARKVSRALDPKWVGKLLRGEVERRKVQALLGSVATRAAARLRRRRREAEERPWEERVEADLDRLQENETRLTLLFSADEAMARELEATGLREKLPRWPLVELVELPGADHTLRPVEAQAALRAALDARLERELAARAPRLATVADGGGGRSAA